MSSADGDATYTIKVAATAIHRVGNRQKRRIANTMSVTRDMVRVPLSIGRVEVADVPLDTCSEMAGLLSEGFIRKLPAELQSRYHHNSPSPKAWC